MIYFWLARPDFIYIKPCSLFLPFSFLSQCHWTIDEYLDEYLAYDNGTDTRYELMDGELIETPIESNVNSLTARFLLFEFAKYFPIQYIASKDTEIAVTGKRARCRLPALLMHSEESYAALMSSKQAVLLQDMPPPSLIVEIVSLGKEN